jgi:hypothetical protein
MDMGPPRLDPVLHLHLHVDDDQCRVAIYPLAPD